MISQLIILIILLFFSAFFSATETAFYSVNRFKVEKLIIKRIPNSITLQNLKKKTK
jgi:Mg2+/Co2+ transporter CorB